MGEIYKSYSKLGLKGIKQNYDKKGMNELLRQKIHLNLSL